MLYFFGIVCSISSTSCTRYGRNLGREALGEDGTQGWERERRRLGLLGWWVSYGSSLGFCTGAGVAAQSSFNTRLIISTATSPLLSLFIARVFWWLDM
ncbi:uncharacterized protein P884DRAFT_1736 [Thermothelomyces heterothallicus CBS 202.75]|uniref:uncharacterized protein n=1 Tax=Thermothelomyces heterothallicus CBS 202.75 TaxID=1149848 RepID=UPI003743C417